MNLKEHFQNPDVILSTNIELALYQLAEELGIDKALIEGGAYNEQIGKAKEKMYKQFSKRLGFDYKWDGHYQITKEGKNG